MNNIAEIQDIETQSAVEPQLSTTASELETVTYSPFDGSAPDIEMNVWRGNNIALLTPTDKSTRYSPDVLQEIVDSLDRAWDFYADFSGREPSLLREIDGLTTIAVVPSTCGAGCGFLGLTGIEIAESPYFDEWLHDTVATTGEYDQILFFELGRNFWFYGDQLQSLPTNAANAFGVANRFLSMAAAGVAGAPFNQDFPFEDWKPAVMDDTSQFYFADESLNWSNTILANALPPGSEGGPPSLLASLLGRVHEDFGTEVYGKMWQAIGAAPANSDDAAEATNLIINSASNASGIDYSFLLKGPEWRFAVGGRDNDDLTAPTTEPGQKSMAHGFGGDDVIRGTDADDLLFGGSGQDTLIGLAGHDTAVGGSGDDRILGGKGDDRLYGGDGNDYLKGGAGSDLMDGGTGNDLIELGKGHDVVKAGSGDDFVYSKASVHGNHNIDLGTGNDSFYAPSGNNTITGQGNNTIGIGKGDDTVTTFEGDDFVYSIGGGAHSKHGGNTDSDDINSLELGEGNNTVWVEQGSYSITTGAGDDSIGLGSGVDTVSAGDGNNIIYRVGTSTTADGKKDILTGTGDDYIQTGGGDDLIDAGAGLNTLFGDAGADVFTIREGAYNFIGDFEIGIDQLSLMSLGVSDLSFFQGTGDVAADAFIFAGDDAIAQVANTTIEALSNSNNFV